MKQYHGWIYIEQSEGYSDHFKTHRSIKGNSEVKAFGYGAAGAAKAVDYFETTLKLGPVKLEKTPLGLRVFTDADVLEYHPEADDPEPNPNT